MMVADCLESSLGGKDLLILVHMRLDKSQPCTLGENPATGYQQVSRVGSWECCVQLSSSVRGIICATGTDPE